ncbi:methyltransferase domain-containing protein [Streptomyces spiralis]|uniref:methyltransferase domain-containing protein n=1 Tax=Streptomyces spiralis TaxID=66376 RepID=UPI0016769ED4|nr:methyltransferase domain-containing protein [Streptomyces spiralis]
MTPTLVRQHAELAGPPPQVDLRARARDWAEIQERMLVPLYEAVHERLEVGRGTRVLALGCGSGLALLMAASRGAAVTGVDPCSPERLALARRRLQPEAWGTRARADARVLDGPVDDLTDTSGTGTPAYTLVTAFEPIGCLAGDSAALAGQLSAAAPLAERGAPVVLAGWGPPERCATSSVVRAVVRPADPPAALRDGLEEVALSAGLRPDGSGRVACPFGYAGLDSAVRGMLSTGLFDAAIAASDENQVGKELTEALHAHQRPDGTVWMPNVFRYLIARTA